MRFHQLLVFFVVVVLVTTGVDCENALKRKKGKGCALNNKVYKAGKTVYKDRSHCLKLKCVKEKNKKKKGKVEYVLRARRYRNCKCFPILCRGPRCSPPDPCPVCTAIWEPVCGTNNITYSNECQLWSKSVPCGPDDTELLHYGQCGECPNGCPKNLDYVCGSDGNTYGNECMLILTACDTNTSITVAHEGPCNGDADGSGELSCGKCPKDRRPVCGSNGVTYNNECLLDAAVCQGENVTLVHKGECETLKTTAGVSGRRVARANKGELETNVDVSGRRVTRANKGGKCRYNGKRYNAGDMIEDLIDYCLTIACQPTKKIKKAKIVFQDFQGANACECSRDKLRKQILRISRP